MTVHYTPLSAVDALTSPGEPQPRIYVERFADLRQDQGSIGGNKNLLGMTVNSATTTDDLGLIIAGAVTDALKKGNALADLHSGPQANGPIPASELRGYDDVIGGQVLLVDVVTKPGWFTVDGSAHISIRVSVTKDGRTQWIGPIEGTASQSAAGGGISDAMSLALDSAIQNCMREMISQLKASGALANKPRTASLPRETFHVLVTY